MRSFKECAMLAHLSNIAYLTTPAAILNAITALNISLGESIDFNSLIGRDDCQAAIFNWKQHWIVAFRGTQFTENFSIREVIEDLDRAIVRLTFGGYHRGAMSGLDAIALELARKLPTESKVIFTGHSLGAARACLFPAFLDLDSHWIEVYAFAPFRSATAGYWQDTYSQSEKFPEPIIFINQDDFAPSWPWFTDELVHASDKIIHLGISGTDSAVTEINTYPGTHLSESDHNIDEYCRKLDLLAASEKE